MPLAIKTFDNLHGGNAFFKAIVHPLAAEKARSLFDEMARKDSVAIYDPLNLCSQLNEIYNLEALPLVGYFIQNIEHSGNALGKHRAAPITEIAKCPAQQLFVTAFDALGLVEDIRHLLPPAIKIFSLDQMRLPDAMLTDFHTYLSPMNFATNFVFFREEGGHHTRLTTTNYWGNYGAKRPALWCRIYDARGTLLIEWQEDLKSAGSLVVLDSRELRTRFHLPEFVGQVFIHAIGIAGHDVVKYALDTYGDEEHVLSGTHDANSWPADYYAGLPAPDKDEDVVLWVQNSHPISIPSGEIGLGVMGEDKCVHLSTEVPPFGTYRLSVEDVLPDVRWPQQIEVTAGKYFVRPRYEVFTRAGRQRISHVNVERTDLAPDPKIALLGNALGKGYLITAPVLPVDRYSTVILPTPMATRQMHLAAGGHGS